MVKELDKIFFLNLDSRKLRWNSLKPHIDHPSLQRFPAVNSIEDPFIYKNYDLTLNPVGIAHTLYFSSHYGAVGCYLSHYLMWKEIIKNKWESVLILEDDIELVSLQLFLQKFRKNDYKSYNLVQLSCKSGFGGTEAYWLDYKAAQTLVETTHNPSLLNKIVPASGATNQIINKGLIKKDTYTWEVKNSITSPSDKFLRYVVKADLIKFKRRKKISLDIGLCNNSSILGDSGFRVHELDKEKLEKYSNLKNFKWWET